MKAALGTVLRRFALTIAAIVCVALDHYIAFDALGSAGAIVTALIRAFLSPFNFLQHQLFRLSIPLWERGTPGWYAWLATVLSLVPYVVVDIVLSGSRADRAALRTRVNADS